ncbi:MAG: hypothetical protein Q9182_001867 [Xanthomendoza sp. 2 TL-2023]
MRHIVYLVHLCILLCTCQSRLIPLDPRQAGNKTLALIKNPSASRKVYTFTNIVLSRKAVSRRSGRPIYGGHSQIWIEGTETDGPLIIELGSAVLLRPSGTFRLLVRSKDLGIANTGKPFRPYISPDSIYHTVLEGQTLLTNAEMFDDAAGTGLIADAWNEDPVYRKGTGSRPNTCYDLLVRVLRRMQLHLNPLTKELFDNSTEYYTYNSRKFVERVQHVASITLEPAGPPHPANSVRMQTKVFNVDLVLNPNAPSLVLEETEYLPSGPALLTATVGSQLTADRVFASDGVLTHGVSDASGPVTHYQVGDLISHTMAFLSKLSRRLKRPESYKTPLISTH